MQLDNLIAALLPADVLGNQHSTLNVLDKINNDILQTEAKLKSLQAKRLQVKYGLMAKCMRELPFKLSVNIFREVTTINMQFANHPEVLRWMRDNHRQFQSLTHQKD